MKDEFKSLNTSQRAMVAAGMWKKSSDKKKEQSKNAVIARLEFLKSERMPCYVCGGYKEITEAHHVYPLSLQAANSVSEFSHDHVWLCPTHHVAVHVNLSKCLSNVDTTRFESASPEEMDAIDSVSAMCFELIAKGNK